MLIEKKKMAFPVTSGKGLGADIWMDHSEPRPQMFISGLTFLSECSSKRSYLIVNPKILR